MVISNNGISKVELKGDWVYKNQPKFLTDNEIWCLNILYSWGYTPYAEQVDIETIRLKYIENEPITNFGLLDYHFSKILKMLRDVGIRHGDITPPNIIINNNKPFLIDFAESRLDCDPRPDKRPGGDEHWLKKTFEELREKSRVQ